MNIERTCMHGSQHAGNEFIDAITFLYKRHQRRDAALIVGSGLEMRENKLLKGIDLILQGHEIGDCLVATIRLAFSAQVAVQINANPSFGSLIVFKLIYSSYSNKPAVVR